jgi:hypothetical protein
MSILPIKTNLVKNEQGFLSKYGINFNDFLTNFKPDSNPNMRKYSELVLSSELFTASHGFGQLAMNIQCPVCRAWYVANTVFCSECGSCLLEDKHLKTEPFDTRDIKWYGDPKHTQVSEGDELTSDPRSIYLRIGSGHRMRNLTILLEKPIRLGRSDPKCDIFPEIDLTNDNGIEYGVSREHACIFRRGSIIEVEDLGSTNGTFLNGQRLPPYVSHPVSDGDQLQMGKLLIKIRPSNGI